MPFGVGGSKWLRNISPGGKSRFAGLLEACTRALPLPPGEVPPEGRGRGNVQTVGGGMQFRMGDRCGSCEELVRWVGG